MGGASLAPYSFRRLVAEMQRRAELKVIENIGFSLEDIAIAPATPRMNEPIIVSGKVKLLKLPFVAPIWVIVTVKAPEKWFEHFIPIWGSPEIREMAMVVGGDFEVTFKKGFDREGEFGLAVRVYAGPTLPINTLTLPPFPPVATEETTFTILGEMPPEEISFSLAKPTVMPATEVEPGTNITISCPVTSESTRDQNIRVKCIIYEGSILPGHGIKLAEFTSGVTPIAPGETKTFDFPRRTVEGTIDRRDIQVEVWVEGTLVKESEWDDIYYVGRPPEEVIDFALTRPSVTPAIITPGTPITITCPVTSACTKEQTIKVKVIIYEGSILPGHGSIIATKWSPIFTISPNQTYNVTIHHTAVAGTIDRRDIQVEVYIDGRLVKESEWDDVYYVKAPEVELELLEVKIDPYGAGYVTVSPNPEGGTQHNWYFPHDTIVYVTAHPNPGYVFKSWSGEMTDTSAITAPVYPMTEKRTITAHFTREVVEQYTLRISIQPVDPRYSVAKSPDKLTYAAGEYVSLTASPAAEFDHWQGDATGRYYSTTIVMDSNKDVVAVFKPAVPETVTFSVVATGFPPLTKYWTVYFWPESESYKCPTAGCGAWIGVNDAFTFIGVKPRGYFSCYCYSYYGDVSDQYNSEWFYAADGARYEYDIASGRVTRLY